VAVDSVAPAHAVVKTAATNTTSSTWQDEECHRVLLEIVAGAKDCWSPTWIGHEARD